MKGKKFVGYLVMLSSIILGILFIIGGISKITPFPAVMHQVQIEAFKQFAAVNPLEPLGIFPDPDIYRAVVGTIEILLGIGLLCPSSDIKLASTLGLAGVSFASAASLVVLQQYMSAMLPFFLFLSLIWIYMSTKEAKRKAD